MRTAVVVALLLTSLALAGCSGQDGPTEATGDDDGQRTSGGDRTSDGGSTGNNTDPPHTTVTILDQVVDLVGPAELSFDVTVPANVTNVDFSMGFGATSAVFNAFEIELSGCGVYTSPSVDIGTVTMTGRICKDANSGASTLIIRNTGFVQGGALRIEGQVPKPVDNSTASSSP